MRRTLVLVLLLLSATFGARAAYACSCAGPSVREAVEQAEVAFVGTVTDDLGDGVYAVRVHGVLKGAVGPEARLRETQPGEQSSCDPGKINRGPVLYAAGRDLVVGQCTPVWERDAVAPALAKSGLTPSAPSPDLAPIGPEPPGSVTRWLPGIAAAVVVAAVVAAGGVVVSRRGPALGS